MGAGEAAFLAASPMPRGFGHPIPSKRSVSV